MSTETPPRTRGLRVLFPVVVVDLIGFGVIIPLLPFYGEHYGATPAVVGLLMATFSLAQFVAAPMWGRLSDRLGRRPVLIASLAGLAASYVGLAFAHSLTMLFVMRTAGGLMAGNIGVAFAYAADVTDSSNRARGMGVIGAAFGLGFIFGPAIGGVLAGPDPLNADYTTPALVAAALSAAALVLALLLLPESLSAEERQRQRDMGAGTRRQEFRQTLLSPGLGVLIALAFLATFVFSGLETTFAMWSRRQFGWGPEQNGYLFAFVGLLSALIQGGLIGRLTKRLGERRLVIAGAAALAVGMVMIPLSGSLPLLLVAMAVVGIGFSLTSPALNSLVSLQAGGGTRGGVMGVTRSATTLSRVLGPMWAGALFFWLGRDWPFLVGGVVMTAVAVIALGLRQPAAAANGAGEH